MGGEFTPGLFLREGYTITSRGCPNRCWFCSVWKRNSELRELPIKDGWIIQDDNLLACSDQHINSVFDMLKKQKHRSEFTGGLEARLLKDWHVERLVELKPKNIFMAYDTPDDYEPLIEAAHKLTERGFTRSTIYCYALTGYPKDTFDAAEKRMNQIIALGITPFSMLWRNNKGEQSKDWRKFQRAWSRPALIFSKHKPKGKDDASANMPD